MSFFYCKVSVEWHWECRFEIFVSQKKKHMNFYSSFFFLWIIMLGFRVAYSQVGFWLQAFFLVSLLHDGFSKGGFLSWRLFVWLAFHRMAKIRVAFFFGWLFSGGLNPWPERYLTDGSKSSSYKPCKIMHYAEIHAIHLALKNKIALQKCKPTTPKVRKIKHTVADP